MLLVVGLGNPGEEYKNTNHNIGFRVVDNVANYFGRKPEKKPVCDSNIYKFKVGNQEVVLAKPLTFMNLSGKAVKGLVKKYNIDVKSELILVADDFDIAPSTVRIRAISGNTTHNGVRSVKQELQTNEFIRVKVSIGPKPEQISVADFVLANTKNKEAKISEELATKAVIELIKGESLERVSLLYSK